MDANCCPLQAFLDSTREELNKVILSMNEEGKIVHVVIGNESGDLDSVVAAIVYSYFRQRQVKQNCKDIFVPVLNFSEDDLILKTEVNKVFELLRLRILENMVFKNCMPKLASLNAIHEVILVDHNMLSEDLNFLHGFVTNVLDHHVDSKAFDDPYVTKTIEPVGSCCTLITEKIYNHSEEIFSEFPVSELLLSAILLDTVNLKQGIGRTTMKDVEFAEDLESHSTISRQELFDAAQQAKYSISHLPVKDILRKDFKSVKIDDENRFGISSITISAHEFLLKENAIDEIVSFAKNNNQSLSILMFIHCKGNETKRELLVYANEAFPRESLLEYMLSIKELNLEKIESTSSIINLYSQGDPKYSRKILTPFVVNFFDRKHMLGSKEKTCTAESKFATNLNSEILKRDRCKETCVDCHPEEMSNNNPHIKVNGHRNSSTNELRSKPSTDNIVKQDKEHCFDSQTNCFQRRDSEHSNDETSSQEDLSLESPKSWSSEPANCRSLSLENLSPTAHPEPSIRIALDEAYAEIDHGFEQPSLEFDENWKSEMYDVKSTGSTTIEPDRKHKIVIRDLSFDDNGPLSELSGIDLLCPVFLAVTEDDEDDDVVLKDMRRKTRSIENLCSTLDDEQDFPLRRTKSELPSIRKTLRKTTTLPEKRTRLRSSSERRAVNMNRNDSIQEEEVNVENPFAGDEDFSDESDALSSVSSPGFDSHSKQEKSLDDASVEAAQHAYHHQQNNKASKTVERFSFSDEECDSTSPDTDTKCKCDYNEIAEWSNQITCPQHVPGLWDRFISVSVGGLLRVVDLKLIDPYVKVITHGGIHETANEKRVVMVFTAAYLPPKYVPKYNIIMEQLFYYAVHTIDLSVGENYDIVYFNSRGGNQPGLDWLKRCYDMVQRRLKKNLSSLFMVHPDLWLKTLMRFYKPFISSKFSRKVKFIKSLHDLRKNLCLEYIFIPDEVKRNDPDSSYWLTR